MSEESSIPFGDVDGVQAPPSIPKRRGRPPKKPVEGSSQPSTTDSTSGTTGEAVRASRTVLTSKPDARKRPKKEPTVGDEQASNLADFLLGCANTGAMMIAGPDGQANVVEMMLIREPLKRILARLPVSAAEKVYSLGDPIALIAGAAIWGVRLFGMRKAASEEPSQARQATEAVREAVTASEQEQAEEDANGRVYAPPVDIASMFGQLG